MTGIYKITNLTTGQSYVGQTIDIERRFAEYRCPKRSHNPKLNADFEKYGIENFEFSILEVCEKASLDEREQFYIKKLDPYYNQIGKPRSAGTRRKLSAAGKRWWNALDAESQSRIINNNLTGPRKGHSVNKETREKLRRANLGKRRFRPVVIIETGQVFPGVKECAEFLGVSLSAVRYNIQGKTDKTKGYHIRYEQCRD